MRIKLLILFILAASNIYGQVVLAEFKSFPCEENITNSSDKLQISSSEDTLIIRTSSVNNCIGLFDPKIDNQDGIINLTFRNYKIDSIYMGTDENPILIQTECICRYDCIWKITGLVVNPDLNIRLNNFYFDKTNSKWENDKN